MRLIFLVILLFFFCKNVSSQNCYSIAYERIFQVSENGMIRENVNKSRLLYNDSLSFYYFIPNAKDKYADRKSFGTDLIHHAVLYNRNNNELLFETDLSKRMRYLIVDSPKIYQWIYNTQKKTIAGYDCNLAYSVNSDNDTTLVWYSSKIGSVFGPFSYIGLPGIVLEVFDQTNNYHVVAKKVEIVQVDLTLPGKFQRLTLEEHKNNIR